MENKYGVGERNEKKDNWVSIGFTINVFDNSRSFDISNFLHFWPMVEFLLGDAFDKQNNNGNINDYSYYGFLWCNHS